MNPAIGSNDLYLNLFFLFWSFTIHELFSNRKITHIKFQLLFGFPEIEIKYLQGAFLTYTYIYVSNEIFKVQNILTWIVQFSDVVPRTRVHISSILPWILGVAMPSIRAVSNVRYGEEEEENRAESETKRGRIGEGETLDPLLGWLPHTADLDAAPANPHTSYVNKRIGECVGNLVVRAISPLSTPSFSSFSLFALLFSIIFYISPTNPSTSFSFCFPFLRAFLLLLQVSHRRYVAWHNSLLFQVNSLRISSASQLSKLFYIFLFWMSRNLESINVRKLKSKIGAKFWTFLLFCRIKFPLFYVTFYFWQL